MFRCDDIEVMADGIVQPSEGAIVEECRLQGDIAQRRSAKEVSVRRTPGNLLGPEILILIRRRRR